MEKKEVEINMEQINIEKEVEIELKDIMKETGIKIIITMPMIKN